MRVLLNYLGKSVIHIKSYNTFYDTDTTQVRLSYDLPGSTKYHYISVEACQYFQGSLGMYLVIPIGMETNNN